MSAKTSPIRVRKANNWFGHTGWLWTCEQHVRHRGFHHSDRREDRYRRNRGLEPDTHPWARAQAAAVAHWHKHHAAPHQCCLAPTSWRAAATQPPATPSTEETPWTSPPT